MTSCKPARTTKNSPESTSDKPQAVLAPRRGRAPVPLPVEFEAIHTRYVAQLAKITVFDDDTRVAYASRVRQYLAWLAGTNLDGDPLADPAARDGAVRDYRTHLQTVLKRAPSTINTVLASLADFYTRHGLGPPVAQRLDLPKRAPRALKEKDTTRWLRTVERRLNPRDRVLALIPFYAGLRIGEAVHLDCDDIQLTARKGLIVVRSGKGNHYREVPVHPGLHGDLKLWIEDERPTWRGADTNPALLLNHRGGRLGVRGARDILATIADEAGIDPEFTSHVLRHSFGTNLVRQGHDLVLVAELMGHRRLETVRTYSLPTDEDRQRAINSLPTDG